jgi:hypothetical protein
MARGFRELLRDGPITAEDDGACLGLAWSWAQDVETIAMAPGDARSAEAARRLEVLLDLIGCLATPRRPATCSTRPGLTIMVAPREGWAPEGACRSTTA